MQPDQASMTARRVAHHRLSLDRVTAPFGRPASDDRLQADVADGLDLGPSPMARYFQARTTWFDRAVVDALGEGVDQVVAVGAGYDGRSLRYARTGVRWFELDHPSTQLDKRRRLTRLELDTTGISFVPADFAVDDVAAVLAVAGHDPRRPTLFTCEGVAAYLADDVLGDLVAALGRVASAGSRLAIEIALVARTDQARARRARLSAAVGAMGEPLSEGLDPDDLEPLLDASGWVLRSATDPAGVPLEVSSASTVFVVAAPADAGGTA